MHRDQMRAVVFDAPAADTSQTRVAYLPIPLVDSGQVLIEVSCAGVNFKDVMVRRGDRGYVDAWPVVPGLEVSGVVAGMGDRVEGFAIGDRVAALTNAGGLAEFAVADAALAARVPGGVSMAAAAVAPGVFATADLLLAAARARAGDVILVHSAGGAVGAAVAALARRLGEVTLLGVVGSPSRVSAAEAAGYDAVFVRGSGLADAVRSELKGRLVDIVLDPQGTAWLDADLEVLAPGGQIIVFGNAAGGELGPLPPIGRLLSGNASIGGFSIAAMSRTDPGAVGRSISRVLQGMHEGAIQPSFTMSRGLESTAALQQQLAEGSTTKHVIDIR